MARDASNLAMTAAPAAPLQPIFEKLTRANFSV
jgi:hypothetical protein